MPTVLEKLFQYSRSILGIMVVMLAGGIFSYITVPKEASPNVDIPVLYVSVFQPGISPEDARRLLVRPLESSLQSLDGLKNIKSYAAEGHALVLMEFAVDFDKEALLADTRTKVEQTKSQLPKDATTRIMEVNLGETPTMVVTLSGTVPDRMLYRNAELLRDKIKTIPSVLDTFIFGKREEVVEVIVNRMTLNSHNISYRELISAVSSNNVFIPAGVVDNDKGRFSIKATGLFENIQDIRNIPVTVKNNAVVTLGDLAQIRSTFKDKESFASFNGKSAISIKVVQRTGENIIETNKKVRQIVTDLTRDWPETIKVGFTLDESKFVFNMLSSLQSSILTAVVMVMIVVLGSLGVFSGILAGITIIASFMFSFLIINLLGMSVNMMVMFGLVLTVGILVDSSIVITEYASRKMSERKSPRQAYQLAVHRMFWPIVASTATTIAAFLPMLFWPGVPGQFISYLPIMVIIVLSASLLMALIFMPIIGSLLNTTVLASILSLILLICSMKFYLNAQLFMSFLAILLSIISFLALYRNRQHIDAMSFNTSKNSSPVIISDTVPFDPNKITGGTGRYVRMLMILIKRPILTIFSIMIIMASILLTAIFIKPINVEFFINEEPEKAFIVVSSRGNFSSTRIRDLVQEIETEILKVNGVTSVFMQAGPRIGGYGSDPRDPTDSNTIGLFTIELADYCCRRKAKEIFNDIHAQTSQFSGILIEIESHDKGPLTSKDIQLDISSDSYTDSLQATRRVRSYFNQLDGLSDIRDSSALTSLEWNVNVDRHLANKFGVNIASLSSVVQLVTQGITIGTYRPDSSEEEVDIQLRLPKEERSISQLDNMSIQTKAGSVPLGNFTTHSVQREVDVIYQKNGYINMVVEASIDTESGVFVTDKIREIDSWLKGQSWQDGVKFHFVGADDEEQESKEFLIKAMMIALSLMAIILVTQFNSFYQTSLTLFTIVLSTIGVILGIMITGQNFSIIMTGTGIVALAGIVVNNAIILIDTYNRMRNRYNLSITDTVLFASSQRLRPILITTTTTVLGLIPMAMQVKFNFFTHEVIVGSVKSMWWVEFSTAIIFGLLFSTILTLILIPVMLTVPTTIKQWFKPNSVMPIATKI